jgi:putative membrane protein
MGIITQLPHINATLNATTSVLLVIGRVLIARRRIAAHRAVMLTAIGVSVLFLVGYITYHLSAPIFVFRGHGPIRPVYYVLLISHVLLAAVSIPLVLVTVWRGLHRDDVRHRRWARWTWPVWMYVSVTGVVVYLMLYQIYR